MNQSNVFAMYLVNEKGTRFEEKAVNDIDGVYAYCFNHDIGRKCHEMDFKVVVEKDGQPYIPDESDHELMYQMKALNISKEEMETEKRRRLRSFRLEDEATKSAEKGTFWISENMGLPWNVNFFLDGYTYEEDIKKCLNILKKHSLGTPYWAIVDPLRDGGLMISILYVSYDKSEWEYERVNENGYIDAIVFNTNFIEYPDMGTIGIKSILGGLKRTA